MKNTSLLMPMFAMIALTACVWVKLIRDRIGEMRSRRIAPQTIATSLQVAGRL